MQRTRAGTVLGAGIAAALAFAGCGTNSNGSSPGGSSSGAGNCVSGSLKGAGSSFQDPMEQTWIAGYAQKCSGTTISYQAVGSGAGIQQFGSGTINYAGSDVTMKPDEQSKADSTCGSKAVHIPVTAGGVGVTYKLSGVQSLQLSAPTIAMIFTGKVKFWDDGAVKADNPGASLPHTAVHPFVRSDDSGTTAVFSGFLAAAGGSAWTLGAPAKHINWPSSDQGKPQSAGVSGAVAQTNGGVTYVEEAFATQHKLALAKVKNAGGTYVELNAANVSKALETATLASNGDPNDLSQKINFVPTDASAYPISTVSYVIVCTRYPSSFSGVALLKAYLTYAVTTGQAQAISLGFAPLPSSLATKAQSSVAAIS
ncbi:MAG: phosphate ABC transporter substrate-binding protein PstS [Actinomycetes bacterium]